MAYARSYSRSRGGFLSGLVRTVGRVAGTVLGGTPVGTAINVARGIMPGGTTALAKAGPGPGRRPEPGITGAVHRFVPGGHTGYIGGRRMNAGNAKAARRAIRRIKAVRKLLQSIERELPRRPAARGGSPGVITRSEASRALRR